VFARLLDANKYSMLLIFRKAEFLFVWSLPYSATKIVNKHYIAPFHTCKKNVSIWPVATLRAWAREY
jgi:hypothetical protein